MPPNGGAAPRRIERIDYGLTRRCQGQDPHDGRRRRPEVLGIMYETMRRRLFAATLVMLLGGCASYAWVKPDATAEMMARDEVACRTEARDLATTGYVYGGIGAPWGYPPWQQVQYPDPS